MLPSASSARTATENRGELIRATVAIGATRFRNDGCPDPHWYTTRLVVIADVIAMEAGCASRCGNAHRTAANRSRFLSPPADGTVGRWWVELTGSTLTFSFTGLVIASCIYSLPFAVQPIQNSFEALPRQTLERAWTLGASRLDAFFSVAAPLSLRGFVSGMVLAFAHTLGEFGVVLMVGGNIPGETRVVSIAIYDHVESLNYAAAHRMSLLLLGFAFAVLLGMYIFNRKWSTR